MISGVYIGGGVKGQQVDRADLWIQANRTKWAAVGAVSTAAFRSPGDVMARRTARMARTRKAVVSGVPCLVARGS